MNPIFDHVSAGRDTQAQSDFSQKVTVAGAKLSQGQLL